MSTSTYTHAIGRRKTATASLRLHTKAGTSTINGKPLETYITRADLFSVVYAPLKLAGLFDSHSFDAVVKGSGVKAQAEALRLALARALVKNDEALRKILRGADLLTRDARKVERKKPGLHKARKASQWSKR